MALGIILDWCDAWSKKVKRINSAVNYASWKPDLHLGQKKSVKANESEFLGDSKTRRP